jgi:hypothetical protein
MTLTRKQVEKICDEDNNNHVSDDDKNSFIRGLQLIASCTKDGDLDSQFYAEHDILLLPSMDELPGLTEDILRKIFSMGFHYNSEFDCIAIFC